MKQFSFVVFGGLAAVMAGIGLSFAAGHGWQAVRPTFLAALRAPLVASAVDALTPGDVSGTTVSGLTRAVRYTAGEEEDLINEFVSRVPDGADGKITADAYLLEDLTTKTRLSEHDSERLLPIASLTKLVTAVIARKAIDSGTKIEITPEIMRTFGNTAGFKAGEAYAASDLLYPLLMVSSNDAAEAYAREYGRKQFIEAMNAFAQSIGAYRTYFADPSGLSAKDESTAVDMAIILDWIRTNDPAILELTKLKTKTIRGHTWVNPAHFLSWSYYRGGKNGFTDEADRTTAALFSFGPEKHVYAVVLLGSENRDTDTIRLLGRVGESKNQ